MYGVTLLGISIVSFASKKVGCIKPVEGSCRQLSVGLDCLLCIVRLFLVRYGLVVHISDGYAWRLVVFGAVVCNKLF